MSLAPLRYLRLELVGKTVGEFPTKEEMNAKTIALLDQKQRRCGYCGHFSPLLRGLEVDHLDGNHGNWEASNLELACHYCHAVRHLEFTLRAGAVLVHVDYPQAALSRLSMQSMQATHLLDVYDKLVEKGVERREHNYPNGVLGSIDYKIRRRMNLGDYAGAESMLRSLDNNGVRVMFPSTYINSGATPPPDVDEDDWNAIVGFMTRQKSSSLRDNDRRSWLSGARDALIRPSIR